MTLTATALADAPSGVQTQMIEEKFFPLISVQQLERSGNISGMILEMDNGEIMIFLDSDPCCGQQR